MTGRHAPTPGGAAKGFRAFTKNWSDLRHTPYGTRPVAVIDVRRSRHRGHRRGVPARRARHPRDLKINIASIISLRSVIGFFLTFAVIGIGWYADRHKRVPLVGIGRPSPACSP